MPSLRNLFAKDRGITELVGRVAPPFFLPKADFGITERLGSILGRDAQANGISEADLYRNIGAPGEIAGGYGNQPEQGTAIGTINAQNPIPRNPNVAPLGGTSAGATGAPSGAFSAGGAGQVAGAQIDTNPYDEEQKRLQAEYDARTAAAANQAETIFQPLAENFSTQLSRLPTEQESLRSGVVSGSELSKNLVNQQLAQSLGLLGKQEENVRTETGRSLRSLAEDQRNTTTSIARNLGSRGAGDTSAGDYAGAAIGRQGLKQRGSVLESQAQGIREIEGRRAEAQNIASQSLTRIEQEKNAQLNSIAADFQSIQRQLEQAKATATSDERRYIVEQQSNLQAELSQALSRLNDEVRQRKAALSDWAQQQEITLQNSLRMIAERGAYDATDILTNIGKAGQLNASLGYQATPQGADYISNTFGLPSGLFEPKPTKEDEKDPLDVDALIEQSLARALSGQ